MTLGHQFLLKTFSVVPSVGWHIDDFGHSSSQAALFSQMGFNAWFFARIDYQDKAKRRSEKSLVMVQHPKQLSGLNNYILTHLFYRNNYNAPSAFCYEMRVCLEYEAVVDNPYSREYNVDRLSDKFYNYFHNMSQEFRSNHLMHPFGSDFQYSNARNWYINLDPIIKYINSHPERYNGARV